MGGPVRPSIYISVAFMPHLSLLSDFKICLRDRKPNERVVHLLHVVEVLNQPHWRYGGILVVVVVAYLIFSIKTKRPDMFFFSYI